MDKKINIAVCILFFEKVDQTIECVDSFYDPDVLIYILNNGSSAESRKILGDHCAKYPNVAIFDSPDNLGVSGGRNYLINVTDEEWLFFVDNDITIKSGWIAKMDEHIESRKDMEAFIPLLYDVKDQGYSDFKPFIFQDGTVKRDENYKGEEINMFPGGAAIINRAVFERLGLYEEKMFVGFEDFEFAIRGIVGGNPVKALLIDDIELVHDHRVAASNADKISAKARYDMEKLKKSSDFIEDKYGIKLSSSWQYWVKNKLGYFTEGKEPKPLSKFDSLMIKIKDMFAK